MLPASEIVIRLAASAVVASIMGWEREKMHKPAGLRTNMLVGVASTLITLVSIDAIPQSDPGRIAAGIVTGIGFLGAGTIFKAKDHVNGLTTAATIWAVSGLGIAIGAGYYLAAGVATGIMFIILQIRKLEGGGIRS